MNAPRILTGTECVCNDCAAVFNAPEPVEDFGELADHELSLCSDCITEARETIPDEGDHCRDCGGYRAYMGQDQNDGLTYYRCMGCGSSR